MKLPPRASWHKASHTIPNSLPVHTYPVDTNNTNHIQPSSCECRDARYLARCSPNSQHSAETPKILLQFPMAFTVIRGPRKMKARGCEKRLCLDIVPFWRDLGMSNRSFCHHRRHSHMCCRHRKTIPPQRNAKPFSRSICLFIS